MRRILLTGAGWLAAAAAATLTGVGAVSIIGSGFTGDSGEVYTEEQVARELAAPTGTPPVSQPASPSGAPTATTTPSNTAARHPLSTPGGTVVAQCVGSDVLLVSWTPAQGFRVSDVERGPDDDAEVTFENSAGEIEVEVRCVDGQPTATWHYDD